MTNYEEIRHENTCEQIMTGFQSLRGSPPELWKAYTMKFLDSFAYFSSSFVFTMFLSSDFGYTDMQAGAIYGLWGALITIYGLLSGFIIDNVGVAASLRMGVTITLVGRILIFLTTSRAMLLFNVLLIMPVGSCLGIPVLTIGIRRYTSEYNRGFAFGLFYVAMNLAALLSGPLVDFCHYHFKYVEPIFKTELKRALELTEVSYVEFPVQWRFTSYRAVILAGIFTNIIACALSFTMREIKVVEEQDHDHEKDEVTFEPVKASAAQIFKEIARKKNFWRFLFMCFITINVRMIYRHMDATLPKYMIREFGHAVPKGTIVSINPALMIILVPLLTGATTGINPLIMIHIGIYISSLSVFFLAVSTSIWACIMFVITLSIGESLWSPRMYDYTMAVVEEGREGTYMALTSAPLFLAKLPVGLMSGALLQIYCPENGERNSQMMWAIIGCVTIVSPLLMTLSWNYINKIDDEKCELCLCMSEEEKDEVNEESLRLEYEVENELEKDHPMPNDYEHQLEPCTEYENQHGQVLETPSKPSLETPPKASIAQLIFL